MTSKKHHIEQQKKKKLAEKKRLAKVVDMSTVDTYSHPTGEFSSIVDAVTFAKTAVYSITRFRAKGNQTTYTTIGTGFLCSPNKMMTCAHVMSNKESTEPMSHHADGDHYFLLSIDDNNKKHLHQIELTVGKNLHIYPEIDMAVITLDDGFYYSGKKVNVSKNMYLRLNTEKLKLCEDVAILGYPVQGNGLVIDPNTGQVNTGNIMIRADKGVVNTTYSDSSDNGVCKYEFTMNFNPGNSGGPILDVSGNAVAIVHGYKSFPIKTITEEYPVIDPETKIESKINQQATIRATYSIGYSSVNAVALIKEHGLDAL